MTTEADAELTAEQQVIALQEKVRELEQVLRQKQHFESAKNIPQQPKQELWIHAAYAPILFQQLSRCIYQANHTPKFNQSEQESRKIYFKYTETGEVLGARLDKP